MTVAEFMESEKTYTVYLDEVISAEPKKELETLASVHYATEREAYQALLRHIDRDIAYYKGDGQKSLKYKSANEQIAKLERMKQEVTLLLDEKGPL